MELRGLLFRLLLAYLFVGIDGEPLGPTVPGDRVKYPEDFCATMNSVDTFDVIVVGAGPAGCTVARRLSEDPSLDILLLEAGGDPPSSLDIPANFGAAGPEFRWSYTTTSTSTSCLGSANRQCVYTAGRVLGGSSSLNGMMYVRGNREDYNDWDDLVGTGWNYEDVLPYFKKSENFIAKDIGNTVSNTTVSSKFHNRGGPLTVNHFPIDQRTHQVREAIIEAARHNGIKFNHDVNGDDQIGFTNIPGMIDATHYRQNAEKVFLRDVPPNLKVCKHALVRKVLFEGIKAIGVEVLYPVKNLTGPLPRSFNIFANKEVILSAGPFNSPAILERSGIGQRSILENLGINVLVDRPGVGENVQDHIASHGSAFKINFNRQAASNPLSMGLVSLTGFINVTHLNSRVPDIQYILSMFTPKYLEIARISDAIGSQFRSAAAETDILFFSPTVLRQGKVGSIHINHTTDPRTNPIFITNQLVTDYDSDTFTKATRLARKIMKHPALINLGAEPFVLRDCAKHRFNSKKEIMCGVRRLNYVLYHVVGACTMGDPRDPKAVVDPQLRVIGVRNLRVIDSSIMPKVTRGNTEIPTIMIAEKGADLVKAGMSNRGAG